MIDDTIDGIGILDFTRDLLFPPQEFSAIPSPGQGTTLPNVTLGATVNIPKFFGYTAYNVTYDSDTLLFLGDDIAHPDTDGWFFLVIAISGASTRITIRGLPGLPLDRHLDVIFRMWQVIDGIAISDTQEPEEITPQMDSFQDDTFQDDTFQ